MTYAAVTLNLTQSANFLLHLATQWTFHGVVFVEVICDTTDLIFSQFTSHLALVRESTLTSLTKGSAGLLAAIYGEAPWIAGTGKTADLLFAWDLHSQTCESLLMNVRQDQLDLPFVTEFGNVSKPANYLRLMLLEETHHRAQMILQLKLLGLDPPDFPGRAWAELGV